MKRNLMPKLAMLGLLSIAARAAADATVQFETLSNAFVAEPGDGLTVYRFDGPMKEVEPRGVAVIYGRTFVGTSRGLARFDLEKGSVTIARPRIDYQMKTLEIIAGNEQAIALRLTYFTGEQVGSYAAQRQAPLLYVEKPQPDFMALTGNPYGQVVADGKYLAIRQGGELKLYDMRTRRQHVPPPEAREALNKVLAIRALTTARDCVWVAYQQTMGQDTVLDVGGIAGVQLRSGATARLTETEGLGGKYCVALVADDKRLFIAHDMSDRGISVVDLTSGRCRVIKTSRNGIDLGGRCVALAGDVLWVGRYDGLVRYDTRTDEARRYTRMDLGGSTVTGLCTGPDGTVWALTYSHYTADDKPVTRASLIQIPAPPR